MRHAEPDLVTDYKRWIVASPPRCCHTCEHYGVDGLCVKFSMQPPEEFASAVGECNKWEMEIPF